MERLEGEPSQKILKALQSVSDHPEQIIQNTSIGSAIFANKPGDGSAREQAASCQKVLGGTANIAREYATKRYRSNCINWGILPFTIGADAKFPYLEGDMIFIPGIRNAIKKGIETIQAKVLTESGIDDMRYISAD